jgi:hypothetical protein
MGTAQGGHYISHVKRDESEWVTISDAHVRKCDPVRLLDRAKGGRSSAPWDDYTQECESDSNAYLLFYRKKTTNSDDEDADEDEVSQSDQIDATVLQRLISEIQGIVLTKFIMSPFFPNLIIRLSALSEDISLLHGFLVHFLRLDRGSAILNTMRDQVIALIKSNAEYGKVILQDANDFTDFIFSGVASSRLLYSSVLFGAIENVPLETIDEFAGNVQSRISMLVDRYESFDSFFEVVNALIQRQNETAGERWAEILVTFLAQTLVEYDQKHTDLKVFQKVNLSGAFSGLTALLEKGVPRAKLASSLLKHDILKLWMQSKLHSCALISFLRELITDSKEMTNQFLALAQQLESPARLSGMLLVSLRVEDSLVSVRDAFFTRLISEAPTAFRGDFLADLNSRIASLNCSVARRFLPLLKTFIRQTLLATDSVLRGNFERLIYALFSEFPVKPVPAESDVSLLKLYFQELIDARGRMFDTTKRAAYDSSSSEFIPTKQYFGILHWILVTGNFYRECFAYAAEFVSLLNHFADLITRWPYNHCNGFICELARYDPDQFFTKQIFAKYLSAMASSGQYPNVPTSLALVRIVPKAFGEEFFRSDAFQSLSVAVFADPAGGPELSELVLALATQQNVRALCSSLWSEPTFSGCLRRNAVYFIKTSWCILRRFPKSARVFFDGDLQVKTWSYVLPTKSILRPVAKLVAEFNIAYFAENRVKKVFTKGFKTDNFVKKWRDMKVDISGLFSLCLSPPPLALHTKIGASGLCRLLESFAMIDPGFCRDLFEAIARSSTGFIAVVSADAQIGAAKMFATVCLRVADKAPERAPDVSRLIVREFASLVVKDPVFVVVDLVSQQCLSVNSSLDGDLRATVNDSLSRVFRVTKDVRMMTSSIGRLAMNASKIDVGPWLVNAANLLSCEVLQGLTAPLDQLEIIGKNIHILLDFLRNLSGRNSVPMPAIPVLKRDLLTLASRFENLGKIAGSDTASFITELTSSPARFPKGPGED